MTLFLRQRLQHHWITVITGLQGWQQWWQNNVPHCSNSNTYYYFIVYLAWNICIQKTGQYRKCCRQYQLTQVEQRFWNLTYSWLHIKTTWVAFTVPMLILVVVQSLSQVQLFWDPVDSSMTGFPVLHCFQEFAQTHVHWVGMPSNILNLCSLLLLLPSIFLIIRVFSNESALSIRWPKYWSFQLPHQPFRWIFKVDFL